MRLLVYFSTIAGQLHPQCSLILCVLLSDGLSDKYLPTSFALCLVFQSNSAIYSSTMAEQDPQDYIEAHDEAFSDEVRLLLSYIETNLF
jgi:hypothetical protein